MEKKKRWLERVLTEEMGFIDSEAAGIAKTIRRMIGAIVTILMIIPLWSSFYTISPDSVGVITRFGHYVRQTEPGLHFKAPWPIESLTKVPVRRQFKEEFGFRTIKAGKKTEYDTKTDFSSVALMLAGDLNIAHVEWSTQYRISDPFKYLFVVRNPRETFRDLNEAVMRAVIGDRNITYILTTGREEIASTAKQEMQKLCNKYNLGITVDQVLLQGVAPPKPVEAAFNEVNQAMQEKKRMINEAWAEYNQVIPRAKGEAQKTIQQAKGFATERVNKALGDVAFFKNLLKAYRENPEITRTRLYMETMQEVLNRVDKTVLDSDVNNLIPMLKVEGGGK